MMMIVDSLQGVSMNHGLFPAEDKNDLLSHLGALHNVQLFSTILLSIYEPDNSSFVTWLQLLLQS